jgi:hypothetical protein
LGRPDASAHGAGVSRGPNGSGTARDGCSVVTRGSPQDRLVSGPGLPRVDSATAIHGAQTAGVRSFAAARIANVMTTSCPDFPRHLPDTVAARAGVPGRYR